MIVVDDELRMSEYLARLLSQQGFSVDIALDGESAISLACERPYAMAFVDFRMPGMNGAELFERLLEEQPGLVGVFVTGYPSLDTVFPAVNAGAARVLSKPVNSDEVRQVVTECLSMS
jgi:DNA-binding NtrC family response regulator